MSYNKQYNTRFSGRYNTPGQFVSAGELSGPPAPGGGYSPRHVPPFARHNSHNPPPFVQHQQQTPPPRKQMQAQNLQPIQPAPPAQPVIKPKDEETPMETEPSKPQVSPQAQPQSPSQTTVKNEEPTPRPHWMKTKLPGVKKVSNKERRRRQNENLRRLLTPKNALMVLNEMMPNEQVANQFKVEPAANSQYTAYKTMNTHNFCADLTIEGNSYKGYGDNKLMARNAAAEQAIRDLIIKKMNKAVSDTGSTNGGAESPEEDALPMIQLASFALHKLFAEWEYDGHKVPQLKPTLASVLQASDTASDSTSVAGTPTRPAPPAQLARPPSPPGCREAAPKSKLKELPLNAGAMHPAMLLTYMRPHLEYREVAVEGDRPQNMTFTMAVDVDGHTFVGKASNKKEARKAAARSACISLFKVQFDPTPSAATPITPSTPSKQSPTATPSKPAPAAKPAAAKPAQAKPGNK
ncbi:DISCO Interacting Protein 1 isoform X3 [Anticarsia gemmatalis]|uniref:DISCO Interacting Protein 1 isoform X3 n=1 Tax=Anticarsia gemmatalis TaxID=129554 RepID=UPI003F777861